MTRFELSLAGLSVMASIVPTLTAVLLRIGGRTFSEDESRMLLFTAIPILLAINGLFGTLGNRNWVIWTAIGGLWGFVVIGAWSIGLFFIPAAVLLSASGLARAESRRNWWNLVLGPLWIVEGVSATASFFLGLAVVRELLGYARFVLPGQTREFPAGAGTIVFIPEAVMFGAWLFASTSCFLMACYLARSLWSGRNAGQYPRWRPLTAALVLALAMGTAACQRALGELERSGASGCSSARGTTTCSAG